MGATKTAAECRYTIESDSPDGGRSTHPECWGPNGRRGRVLAGCDTLDPLLREWGRRTGVSGHIEGQYPKTAEDATAGSVWICDRGTPLGRDDFAERVWSKYGGSIDGSSAVVTA